MFLPFSFPLLLLLSSESGVSLQWAASSCCCVQSLSRGEGGWGHGVNPAVTTTYPYALDTNKQRKYVRLCTHSQTS